MSRHEFFDHVLAPEGYVCILGLMSDSSAPPKQLFFKNHQEAEPTIEELCEEGREVYFACATFADPKGKRSAKNTVAYKSFYIDIDCGAGKPYPNQKAGLQALGNFLEEARLPIPTLVNSGNGIHGYWVLDTPIPYNEWRPIADGLRQTMARYNFEIDSSVSTDGARVLRIPGTKNYKNRASPRLVKLVKKTESIDLEAFRMACGVFDTKKIVTGEHDPILDGLKQKNLDAKFSKIKERCVREDPDTKKLIPSETGCQQIADAIINQATTDYDVWRGVLSIAVRCVDGETAIHEVSKDHPKYIPEQTEAKAADTIGPFLCKTFQNYRPAQCLKCALKGKISSPITLGIIITPAAASDNIRENIWHRGSKQFVDVDIPLTYPKPWIRPKTGGVALMGPLAALPGQEADNDEEPEEKIVYLNDLWVQERIEDPNYGEMLRIAHILPMDGMREIVVPCSQITKKDKCQELLASFGVAAIDKRMELLRRYVNDWNGFLQTQKESVQARLQFGWHDNNSCFILGNREYLRDGTVRYSPSSSVTEDIAPIYTAKGSLDQWKTVVNNYGVSGNEARAFALFIGFGAPLYKFLGLGSMIVHLTNVASGVGKSTIQMAINSIYGHPMDALLNENDTANARQSRAGVLNNLPMTIDEITNIAPEAASDFVFQFNHNRGKNRLQAQVNAERRNTTKWATIAITSGNNSLYDTIKSFKASSEGEMYRIMEIQVFKDHHLAKHESDQLFNHTLFENYGVAGERYIQHLVSTLDTVREELLEQQRRIDKLARITDPKERFYSGLIASAITGGRVANRLGVHNINVDSIEKWAINLISHTTQQVTVVSNDDTQDTLGQFINEHNRNIVVCAGSADEVTDKLPRAATLAPQGEIVGRYDCGARRFYAAQAVFRKWCTERRIPYAPFVHALREKNFLLADSTLQLGKGTPIPGGRVRVLVFDSVKLGEVLDTLNEPA